MSARSARTTAPARVAAAVVALLLATAGIVALAPGAGAASTSSMLSAVNSARADRGVPALSLRSDLSAVALAQAKRMANRDELYHNPNLRNDVNNWRWIGENVGYGPSVSAVQKGFMGSPTHKANILDDDFTEIGLGAVTDRSGRVWVTQVFRQPKSSSRPSAAPKPKPTSQPKAKTSAPKRTASSQQRRNTSVPTRTTAPAPRPTPSTAPQTSAPRPTRSSTPKVATPKPTPTATPDPAATLANRVENARVWRAGAAPADPVDDALTFAATMAAITG